MVERSEVVCFLLPPSRFCLIWEGGLRERRAFTCPPRENTNNASLKIQAQANNHCFSLNRHTHFPATWHNPPQKNIFGDFPSPPPRPLHFPPPLSCISNSISIGTAAEKKEGGGRRIRGRMPRGGVSPYSFRGKSSVVKMGLCLSLSYLSLGWGRS